MKTNNNPICPDCGRTMRRFRGRAGATGAGPRYICPRLEYEVWLSKEAIRAGERLGPTGMVLGALHKYLRVWGANEVAS